MNTSVTPILRIFDYAKTKEFYVDFLGFTIDWEHRFEENMPVYLSVSSGPVTLHLSEHHGDGSPGARVRIHTPTWSSFRRSYWLKNTNT
nr:glyoxalase superfamily protein [Tellurirhabdus rosea]